MRRAPAARAIVPPVLVAAIAVLLGATAAPRLSWEAPAGCPDQAAAHATIERLLGGATPVEGPGAELRAEVRIVADGPRFIAHVRLGEAGARTIEASTCAHAADAALLIVAMAIDPRVGTTAVPEAPLAEEPPPEPEPELEPAPEPPPESEPTVGPPSTTTDTTPVEPPPSRRSPLRAMLRASAGVGVGGPPRADAVVAIGVALAGRRFRVELDGDLWTPTTRTAPDEPSVGVEVLGWTLGVRGCGSPVANRFELPLCGGLRTGALRGRGTGALTPRAASSIWVTATAGVGLWGWIRPRFALALDVEAFVAITAPRFRLDPGGLVYTASPGGLRAVLGPVVRLP